MKVKDVATRLGLPADTNTESVIAVIDARQSARRAQANARTAPPPAEPPAGYDRSWLSGTERRRAEGKAHEPEIRRLD